MEERNIQRGAVYYADLDPVQGSEQSGCRPVLNIQNSVGNKYSPTIIVAAITSKPKSKLPTHVPITGMENLEKDSVVLLEQLRTIDKLRLKEYLGLMNKSCMKKVDEALCISLEIPIKENPMLICLCSICARQFYDSPEYYIRRSKIEQQEKETCMFCNVRQGYDFVINKRSSM